MGNVRMRAEQINYGASNVKVALDDLDPKDLIALSERMDAIEAWKATVKAEEKTGAEVTFTNALALAAVSLSAEIEAEQDLHGYDYPWVGGAGKNKAGGTITGAYVGSSGTIGADASFDLHYGKVTSGVTYTITTDDPNFVGGFFENEPAIGSTTYDGQRVVTNNKTFTAPITGYVAFRTNSGYTTAQLEVGETATSYAPYSNICPISGRTSVTITDYDSESNTATVTVQLGQTVYGGTLNVTTGALTVKTAKQTLNSDLTWVRGGGGSIPTGRAVYYFTEGLTGAKPCGNDDNSNNITMKSNVYNIANKSYNAMRLETGFALGIGGDSNSSTIGCNVSSTDIPDASAFETWLDSNPIEIEYPLATPQTIQLTPTDLQMLKGYNRLSCDGGGDITVEAYTGSAWGGDTI